MKIRIGNDIRLRVNLVTSDKQDAVNINSIKAYLINTTEQGNLKEQFKSANRDKYISRFPIEPMDGCYNSTQYDICQSGFPTYHVKPFCHNVPYCGFGVYPHTFDAFSNHLWAFKDIENHKLIEYLAPVEPTEDRNRVNVFFPAEDQVQTGSYKLVIVAKLYVPGYSSKMLKTVTMDYNDVFTLVDSSDEEGVNNDVTMTVGNKTNATYIVVSGNTAMNINGNGKLNAVVYPLDIDDERVDWKVAEQDKDYIAILWTNDNSCYFKVMGMPANKNSYTATIIVSSCKNPEITKEVGIVITSQYSSDVYVHEGGMSSGTDDHNIRLRLTDGQVVDIDTSAETQWYEGD